MYELAVIGADLAIAGQNMLSKVYQKKAGDGVAAGLLYNTVLGAFTAIIFYVLNGFKFDLTPFSLLMGTLASLCAVLYTILGFKIMARGYVAIYSLFLMLGVMILPYLYGVIFLDETANVLRWIGLVLLVVSIVLSGETKSVRGGSAAFYIFLCILVFMLNGFLGIFSKMHQIETVYPTMSDSGFVSLCGLVKFVFCGAAYVIYRLAGSKNKKTDDNSDSKPDKKTVIGLGVNIFLTAAISGLGYFLQLIGAANLPASVMFPILTGGTIVISAFAGLICFKENLSKKAWIGIALCFAATLLFL